MKGSQIVLQNITSFGNSDETDEGGCIKLEADETISIIDSFFEGGMAILGGGLFIQTQEAPITISNVSVANCKANLGGGIYSETSESLFSIEDSIIENNSATKTASRVGAGGGLFLRSFITGIASNSTFHNNYADEGGAIKCSYELIDTSDSLNIFSNNTDIYGNSKGIAHYPYDIQIKLSNAGQPSVSKTIDIELNAISGENLEDYMILEIQDAEGNTVLTDNETIATLAIHPEFVLQDHQVFHLQDNTITAVNGTISLEDMQFLSTPNNSVKISLNLDARNENEKKSSYLSEPVTFQVNFFSCEIGEELTDDPKCNPCEVGKYSYIIPTSIEDKCKDCLDHSICFGRNYVAPEAGYWRADNTSEMFLPCLNPHACMYKTSAKIYSREGDENNPLGVCNEEKGYQGILCNTCKNGYVKFGNKCTKCPETNFELVLLSIGLVAAMLVIIIYLVKFSAAKEMKKSNLSVLIKIFTNFVTLLSIIWTSGILWPDETQSFFESSNYIGQIFDALFNFDCFLKKKEDFFPKLYYMQLILFGHLPIGGMLIAAVIWLLKLKKSGFKQYFAYVFCTSIVIIFLVHFSISKQAFSIFNCLEIKSGKYHLLADLEIECYSNNDLHYYYMFGGAIPIFFIWVIGAPAILMLFLYKQRKIIANPNLMTEIFRIKYGFLINGYCAQTFYWEFIIIMRKCMIILITVFDFPIRLKVILIILFLILNLWIQNIKRPFLNDTLNTLEISGLFALIGTMLLGLFFLPFEEDEELFNNQWNKFFSSCIIIVNGLFLLYFGWKLYLEILTSFQDTIEKLPWLSKLLCYKYISKKFIKKNLKNSSVVSKPSTPSPAKHKISREKNKIKVLNSIIEMSTANRSTTFMHSFQNSSCSPMNRTSLPAASSFSQNIKQFSPRFKDSILNQLPNPNKNTKKTPFKSGFFLPGSTDMQVVPNVNVNNIDLNLANMIEDESEIYPPSPTRSYHQISSFNSSQMNSFQNSMDPNRISNESKNDDNPIFTFN